MMFQNNKNEATALGCAGPCQAMLQATAGTFDQAFKAWEPTTKGVIRANLELVALANRRSQAYLDIPGRLAQCRTPQDLIGEQTRFWQTAFAQYQESSQQLMSIWSGALPAFNMFGFERAAETVRDYITLPESREPAAPSNDRPATSRRAA